MNCDQAFDVMTSSRRSSDGGLHAHLDGCRRCREMRETLEPALEMFSAEPSFSPQLAPWEVGPEGNDIATQAARRLTSTETDASAPKSSLTGLWGYAATVVLGAGLVWCTIIRHPSTTAVPTVHRAETKCLYLAESRPRGLTGQQMTQSCLACHTATGRE